MKNKSLWNTKTDLEIGHRLNCVSPEKKPSTEGEECHQLNLFGYEDVPVTGVSENRYALYEQQINADDAGVEAHLTF